MAWNMGSSLNILRLNAKKKSKNSVRITINQTSHHGFYYGTPNTIPSFLVGRWSVVCNTKCSIHNRIPSWKKKKQCNSLDFFFVMAWRKGRQADARRSIECEVSAESLGPTPAPINRPKCAAVWAASRLTNHRPASTGWAILLPAARNTELHDRTMNRLRNGTWFTFMNVTASIILDGARFRRFSVSRNEYGWWHRTQLE